MALNDQTSFYRMKINFMGMVYVYFHRPSCTTEFSLITKTYGPNISKTDDYIKIMCGDSMIINKNFQTHSRILSYDKTCLPSMVLLYYC